MKKIIALLMLVSVLFVFVACNMQECDFCGEKIKVVQGRRDQYHFYSYSGMVSCMSCYGKAVCSQKYNRVARARNRRSAEKPGEARRRGSKNDSQNPKRRRPKDPTR